MAARRRRLRSGGKALRAWRESQSPRVSAADLATRLGKKSGSSIIMYELGTHELRDHDCVALSEMTGIPLAVLFSSAQRKRVEKMGRLLAKHERKAG